jgi:hypothetical protein
MLTSRFPGTGLTESVTVPNVEQDVFYRLASVHVDQPDLHVPTIREIKIGVVFAF